MERLSSKKFNYFTLKFCTFGLLLFAVAYGGTSFSYTGVQAFRQNIQINDLKFESQGGLISWFFTDGNYYGHFGLGMADHKLDSVVPGVSRLDSKRKFMWNFEITRMLRMVYFSTGVNYYNISGNVDVSDSGDAYTYKNHYRLYEFPVASGLHLNLGQVFVKIGYRQNYYYGKRHYNLLLTQGDTSITLNSEKYSFDDRSEKFYEGALSIALTKNLYFDAHYAYNKNSDEKFMSVILGFRL